MLTVNERLKELRKRAQPSISTAGMAQALGVTKSAYYFYESASGFKQEVLPLHLARRIADALEGHGIERAEVLALAGAEVIDAGDLTAGERAWIIVWRALSRGQRGLLLQMGYDLLGWKRPECEPDLEPALARA